MDKRKITAEEFEAACAVAREKLGVFEGEHAPALVAQAFAAAFGLSALPPEALKAGYFESPRGTPEDG